MKEVDFNISKFELKRVNWRASHLRLQPSMDVVSTLTIHQTLV